MNRSKNGKLIRRTVYIGPKTDEALKKLAQEWDTSYTEVANVMFGRGMAVEGLRKAGCKILTKDGKQLPFNDDRPIKRKLLDEEP